MGRHPEHSIEEIDDFITACEDDYANTNKQNMAQLSIDALEHLMIDDLKEKRRYVIIVNDVNSFRLTLGKRA